MTSLTTIVIRIFALISCFYGLYEDDGGEKLRYVFNLYRPPKFLQLTQLCLLFVVIIDFIGLIQHRIKCAMKEGLEILRNILIVNCVGLSSVVFFGFWGLYFYDSGLIILKEMHDLGYKPPMSCNLSEHVFPFIYILYEFSIEEVEVIWGIFLIPFSFIYYFASEYYFKRIGRWQYGILNEVNTFARVLLFAEFTILALITIVSVHLIKIKVKDLRTRNLKID